MTFELSKVTSAVHDLFKYDNKDGKNSGHPLTPTHFLLFCHCYKLSLREKYDNVVYKLY